MYTAYTNWLKNNAASVNWDTASLTATLFTRSSGFLTNGSTTNDAGVAAATRVEDLLARPGWQMAPATPVTVAADATTSSGVTTVVLDDPAAGFGFSCAPLYLDAVAVSLSATVSGVVNPLLMVFRPDSTVLFGGSTDGAVARPGRILQNNGSGQSFLFQFSGTPTSLTIPNVEIAVPVLGWESAHSVHVWMSPTRVNYAANPSFESLGTGSKPFGWRSDATLVRDPVAGGTFPYCGRMTGAGATKVLESNYFPASNERGFWTVRASVEGAGTYRIGVLFWMPGMAEADCLYAYEDVEVSSSGFVSISTVVPAPEAAWEAQFRLEYTGTECRVDDVLVEPNEARDVYFDGSTELCQPGDTAWYGHDTLSSAQYLHKSFSTYYPDRERMKKYLYGYTTQAVGQNPVRYPGTTYGYVPEGNQIVPHWDDVYYARIHSWTRDVRIPVADFPALGKTTVTSLT